MALGYMRNSQRELDRELKRAEDDDLSIRRWDSG